MRIKCFICLIGLFAITKNISAQNVVIPFDSEYMTDFYASTLKVCLVGDEKYDAAIKEAIKNNWTLTKFDFIDYSEVKNKKVISDKTSSFLLPLSMVKFGEPHLTPNLIYHWKMLNDNRWLCILPGGRKGVMNYSEYDIIAYSPFDNLNLESNILQSAYRLGLMIKSMQDAIIITRDNKMKANTFNLLKNVLDKISTKATLLKTKTLLVNQDLFSTKNEKGKFALSEDVLKAYSFSYKIVSQAEIETAIKNKDRNSCYFCPVFGGYKDIYIYNLENMEVVYATYELKGTTVERDDISRLNNTINSN